MGRRFVPMAERFWARVEVRGPDDCWEWTGGTFSNGYGRISLPGRGGGNKVAHRYSWEIHNGEIPEGLLALHTCDNPPCVNPAHLFLGTHADNTADMVKKDRHGIAKLNPVKVIDARRRYAAGATYAELAKEHGMTKQGVGLAVRGVTWGWVQEGLS